MLEWAGSLRTAFRLMRIQKFSLRLCRTYVWLSILICSARLLPVVYHRQIGSLIPDIDNSSYAGLRGRPSTSESLPSYLLRRPLQKSSLAQVWSMSHSQLKPWSDNPNAPRISYNLYREEKAIFAGGPVGSILYGMSKALPPTSPICAHSIRSITLGIVIVLFFKCMFALFSPVHRRGEPVKWGLVSYTIVIFAVETLLTAMNLHLISIAWIDNREYPGVNGETHPGPVGYQFAIAPKAPSIIANTAFTLSDWLANGLLVGSLFDAALTHPCV